MTKSEVIVEIGGKYNMAQGCVMFVYILGTVPWRDSVKNFVGPGGITIQSSKNYHSFTFTPDQILKRYEHPSSVQDDGLNIIRLGLTDAICQAFECIKDFCEASSQMDTLRAFHWYHFVRLIRNCFSHNFRLNLTMPLTKADKRNGLTVKWLAPQTITFSDGVVLTLDQSLHGNELDFDVLPIKYAFELIDIMKSSVQSGLSG